MVEDVLAEHLLLGRYEPGTTIVVDRDPEAGLDIHAAEPLTPVEARLSVGARRARPLTVARAGEPLRLPELRRGLPSLGGPVPRLRRLEQPRRDRRPVAEADRARHGPRHRPGRPSRPPRRSTRSRRRPSRGARSGSASWTASSAADWSPGRSSCSAASRGSASPRCCSRPRPASSATPDRAGRCTPRGGVAVAGPPARRPPRAARRRHRGTRSGSSPSTTSAG